MREQTRTANEAGVEKSARFRIAAFHVVVTLLMAGVTVTFWKVNLFPFLAWLPDEFLNNFYASQLEFDHITSGGFSSHTIHYLAIAATHWSLMFGLALQFKNPLTKIAPMWQVTAGIAVVTLTYPFIEVSRIPPPVFGVIVLALIAGLLHPARIFRTPIRFRHKTMLLLAAGAAVPAVLMIVGQIGLQASGVDADPHWQGLHYSFVGEYGLVLLLVLALGASSLAGWRYSAWTGAFLTALLGVGFVSHSESASSQGTLWGLTMVVFSLLWLLLGERSHRSQGSSEA